MRSRDEGCDDGNAVAGDGCDVNCRDESAPLWHHPLDEGLTNDERFSAAVHREGRTYVLSDSSGGWQRWNTAIVAFDRDGLVWQTPRIGADRAGISDLVAADDRLFSVGYTVVAPDEQHGVVAAHGFDGAVIGERAFPELHELTALALADDGDLFLAGLHYADDADVWFGRYDVAEDTLEWTASTPRLGSQERATGLAYDEALGLYAISKRGAALSVERLDPDDGQRLWLASAAPDDLEANWNGVTGLALSEDFIATVGYGQPQQQPLEEGRHIEAWISTFTPDGTLRWRHRNEAPGPAGGHYTDVVALPDGHLLATGQMQFQSLAALTDTDYDAIAVEYDRDGSVVRTLRWDGPLHLADSFESIVPLEGEHMLAVGQTSEAFASDVGFVAEFVLPAPAPIALQPALPARTTQSGDVADLAALPKACAHTGPRSTTLYVDFDGASLRPGDDGRVGEMPCLDGPLAFPGYDEPQPQIEAVMQRVEEILAPYDVAVYWETPPPAGLPYTTVVVGGAPEQIGLASGTAGFACVIDCADTRPNDLALAFYDERPSALSNTIVHEAAHTWGFDHVDAPLDVMAPFEADIERTLLDTCAQVSDRTSAPGCLEAHAAFCDPGQQNVHAELEALFGPARLDETAPSIDGLPEEVFVAPGEAVVLDPSVHDDSMRPGLELRVPDLDVVRVLAPDDLPFAFYLPEGEHTVELRAYDHAGNETVKTTTVVVDESVFGGSSGEGDSDDPVGSSSTGDDTAGVSSTTAGGCACTTSGPGDPPSPGWLGVGLWVLGLRLRRASGA